MRGKAIAAALACAALTVGLAACGDSDDGVKLEKKTFKITEKDTNDFSFTDNPPRTKLGPDGPEKMSGGDVLAFRSNLIRAGKDVGDLFAECTAISGTSFENVGGDCTGVYELPEGSLTGQVGGTRLFGRKTTTGIITGGTGDYFGASGTFVSPNNDDEDTVTTIKINVPED